MEDDPDKASAAAPLARHRARPRRRRVPVLAVIIAVGIVAVATLVGVATTFDQPRPHGPYVVGAWTFGDRDSLRRAVRAGAIDEVSVDWLQSRADGSLEAPKYDRGYLDLARKLGCRVFVTLTDYDESTHSFDPAISAAILATAQSRRQHVAAVAAWCREQGVEGVDVDWEALQAGQRASYTRFVQDLARALHHDGRDIAVDVYPKTSEPGGWSGPQAQDWSKLGRAVDEFRVMTYNFSGSWSEPGPLSPPLWMSRILDFAETQVQARKIVMGIGLYGRDWRGPRTTDLLWADVQQIRARSDPHEQRDGSGELCLAYGSGSHSHIAYFPDATAMSVKVHMLLKDHPHIRGVFCWIMGQEDPAVWSVFRRQLH